MKSLKNTNYPIVQATLFLLLLLNLISCRQVDPVISTQGPDKAPGSWMYNQRAFPNGINREAKKTALEQHNSMTRDFEKYYNKEWVPVGPINIGGRMTDVSLHPTEKRIIYAGSSVGGVWKTINRGIYWKLIFEEQGAMSIGNIEVSSSDPNTIYIGTGEANGSGTSGAFFGNGMYKSTDAGTTWENIGLPSSDHIGRILIHPDNSEIVYAAVAGKLYDKNEERGLYKTINGGESWEQVLFISDSTAVIDISFNPQEPNVIFAATWERTRSVKGRRYAGITSGLYKSTNGGLTWELLTNGLPQADVETGRIGVMVSPSDPNRVYASFTSNTNTNIFDAVYSSSDQGASWTELNGQDLSNIYSLFGWFFGNVRVHPTNPDEVYLLGVRTYKSKDGGDTWRQWTSAVHVDQHGMEFHQTNPDFIVIANDGGIYITENAGMTFFHVKTIANNQLYECAIHPTLPETYLGGAQDNGILVTTSDGIAGYRRINIGDGFSIKFDYVNPELFYVTAQFGLISRKTALTNQGTLIKPSLDLANRYNWNTPFVTIPNEENGILLGAEHLLYSQDAGEEWEIISPDLTNGPYENTTGFGTISALAISEINSDIILVGTDDGNVQITIDRGLSWTKISDDLPLLSVSSVATDPYDAATIYVTYSGYRFNNYLPHVLRSSDFGETWEDIGSNLPESPINDIVIDPSLANTYYIASDESVYYTSNGGSSWEILGKELPLTVYTDLDLHDENRELLAATFGRSMLKYELPSEPLTATSKVLDDAIRLYPNPSSDFINIELSDNKLIDEIIILDISGRLVKNVSIHQSNIDISSLPVGNYFLRIATKNSLISKKFSKI